MISSGSVVSELRWTSGRWNLCNWQTPILKRAACSENRDFSETFRQGLTYLPAEYCDNLSKVWFTKCTSTERVRRHTHYTLCSPFQQKTSGDAVSLIVIPWSDKLKMVSQKRDLTNVIRGLTFMMFLLAGVGYRLQLSTSSNCWHWFSNCFPKVRQGSKARIFVSGAYP